MSTASQTAPQEMDAKERPAEGSPSPPSMRDLLDSAWFLTRRNLILAVWEVLGGMVQSVIGVVGGVAIVLPFILLAMKSNLGSLGGLLHFINNALRLLSDPLFLSGAIGVAFTLVGFTIALTALVHGGIYGKLAHALRPSRGKSGFWRLATEHFATMVGYTGLRFLVQLALGAYAGLTVLWPLVLLDSHLVSTGQVHLGWALITALGAASSILLALLVTMVRLVVLGPLLLEDKPLFEAVHDATAVVGANLGRWLKILFSTAFAVSPIYLVYWAFSLLMGLVSTHPTLSNIVFIGQSILDMAMAVASAGVLVYFGAAVLIEFARLQGLIPSLPGLSPPAASPVFSGPRQRLTLGRPMSIPGLGIDAQLLVMPMPTSHGSIQQISEVFPAMAGLLEEAAQRQLDEVPAAETAPQGEIDPPPPSSSRFGEESDGADTAAVSDNASAVSEIEPNDPSRQPKDGPDIAPTSEVEGSDESSTPEKARPASLGGLPPANMRDAARRFSLRARAAERKTEDKDSNDSRDPAEETDNQERDEDQPREAEAREQAEGEGDGATGSTTDLPTDADESSDDG